MTTHDDHEELERLADAELKRRMAPPFNPDYALIACRGCARRLYDDNGKPIRARWIDRIFGC